jgi:hypothetical protein
VDSDDLCVAVVSPIGETVVPLVEEWLLSVETPSLVDECWLLLEIEEFDGIGATGAVVDCVVDELDEELCAKATPVISVTAIAAARKVLVMMSTPEHCERKRRSLPRAAPCRARDAAATGSETTHQVLALYRYEAVWIRARSAIHPRK